VCIRVLRLLSIVSAEQALRPAWRLCFCPRHVIGASCGSSAAAQPSAAVDGGHVDHSHLCLLLAVSTLHQAQVGCNACQQKQHSSEASLVSRIRLESVLLLLLLDGNTAGVVDLRYN